MNLAELNYCPVMIKQGIKANRTQNFAEHKSRAQGQTLTKYTHKHT